MPISSNTKTNFSHDAGVFLCPTRVVVGLLFGSVLVFTGCSKSAAPPAVPAATAQQDVNPAASPTYVRPETPTVLPPPPTGQPDLKQLTTKVRSWVARTHRVPKDLEDFEAQANVQFPPPPAGKKFALGKRMTVILVSQ